MGSIFYQKKLYLALLISIYSNGRATKDIPTKNIHEYYNFPHFYNFCWQVGMLSKYRTPEDHGVFQEEIYSGFSGRDFYGWGENNNFQQICNYGLAN